MNQYEIFPAGERGKTSLGWLESRHSFSFGSWYRPDRMGFGLLRVLNDDVVAGGAGFDAHPHDNMEIISIPLEGSIEHRDSMGNRGIISAGDVQIMSAGTGIFHSEYNSDPRASVRFLQIWILPYRRNLPPRYAQMKIDPVQTEGKFAEIISPEEKENCLMIQQNARFFIGSARQGTLPLPLPSEKGIGIYLFLIEGKIRIFGEELADRDAIGILDCTSTELEVLSPSKILLMHLPIHQNS